MLAMHSLFRSPAQLLHDLRDVDHERAADGKKKLVGGAGDEYGHRRRLGRGLDEERQHRAAEHDTHGEPRREVRRQSSPRLFRDPVERQAEAALLESLEDGD